MVLFLGVHRFTSLAELRREVGCWHKTQCNTWVNMCRFWNRLIRMSDSRLTFKTFEWDMI